MEPRDLVQLGGLAPFVWLFWQYDKACREERERMRATHERVGIALELLVMRMSGKTLSELQRGKDDVQ